MKTKIYNLLNSAVFTNSVWLMILQMFNTVLPLVTLPYITRVLGAVNYGYFSIALNWITYFQVIVEFGFGFTGARKVSISEDKELQPLFSRIITARLLLLALTYLAMILIPLLFKLDKAQFISMNILFLIILGIVFQLTWLFQGKQDMKYITIINAVSRIVSVMFVFALIKKQEHLYLYCFCYAATFILSSVLGLILTDKKYGLKLRFCSVAEAMTEIKDAWHLFLSQAMAKMFSGIGLTILGIVAAPDIAGIYSAIYKIPYMLILFFSPVSQAIYPHVSVKFSHSYDEGKRCVTSIAKWTVPFFFAAGFFIILMRKPLINIAFGPEYLKCSIITIPLAIWAVFSVINNFLGIQMLVASGRQKLYSKVFALNTVLMLLLNVVLGNAYGIYGISIAAPISEIILSIMLYIQIKK